jgi:hypothetical protein
MSIKSSNRAYKNRNQRSASSPLDSQKQTLKLNMFYCLASSVVLFALNILGIIVVFQGENTRQILVLSIIEMIFAGTFIHCFIAFGRRFKIYQQLNKIQFSTEQLFPIHCNKISFLYKPISKYSSSIICIIIVDEYGNKFYYVYPKEGPSEFANKFIKQQCLGKHLELNCYKNTYMIKTLFI